MLRETWKKLQPLGQLHDGVQMTNMCTFSAQLIGNGPDKDMNIDGVSFPAHVGVGFTCCPTHAAWFFFSLL